MKGSSQPTEDSSGGKERTRHSSLIPPTTRKQQVENQKSQNLHSSSLPCGHWRRSQAIFVGTGPWCRGPWMSGSSWSASRPPHGQLGCCQGLPALWTVPPGRSAGERGGLSTHACLPARTSPLTRGKKKPNQKTPISQQNETTTHWSSFSTRPTANRHHCALTAALSRDYGR